MMEFLYTVTAILVFTYVVVCIVLKERWYTMSVLEIIFNTVALVVFIIAMCLVSNDEEH